MIAMAMALNPALLIADEPTTALDVTVQAQVLRVIRRMQEVFGTAVILITHDLGVIADVADDVLVMYGGKVMERADRRTLFFASHHPYTEGLLQSMPAYGGERGRLRPIAGQPPSLLAPPSGLPVRAPLRLRDGPVPPGGCPRSTRRARSLGTSRPAGCRTSRPTVRPSGAEWRRSNWPGGRAGGSVRTKMATGHAKETDPAPAAAAPDGDDMLLRVDSLVKDFPIKGTGLFREKEHVHAVDGVSCQSAAGKTFGVVGETGCGKSTLARCIARLYDVTSGRIVFDGQDITRLSQRRMRPLRREIQLIFQDPIGSLNPRRRVGVDHRGSLRDPRAGLGRGTQAPGAGADGAGGLNPSTTTGSPRSSPAASGSASGWPGRSPSGRS